MRCHSCDAMQDYSTIVCLVGSTSFKEAYEKVNRDLTLLGEVVLSCGVFHKREVSKKQSHDLHKLHMEKINMADYIFVVNVGGYIGDQTKNEIEYAKGLGKPVTYLEQCRFQTDKYACCLPKCHDGFHTAECGTSFGSEWCEG